LRSKFQSKNGIVISLLWLIFPAWACENAKFWWKSGLGELKIAKLRPRQKSWCFWSSKNAKNQINLQKIKFFNLFFHNSSFWLIFCYFSRFLSPKFLSFIEILILCFRFTPTLHEEVRKWRDICMQHVDEEHRAKSIKIQSKLKMIEERRHNQGQDWKNCCLPMKIISLLSFCTTLSFLELFCVQCLRSVVWCQHDVDASWVGGSE
jgi:hypothetical protein